MWGHISPGHAAPHFLLLSLISLSVSLSLIPRNLNMTISGLPPLLKWLITDGNWLLFSIYSRYCLVICNVGHVGAVRLRGPWERLRRVMKKGRGPENYTTFVSIPDTTTPTISPQTMLSQSISDEQQDGDIDSDSNVPDTSPQGTFRPSCVLTWADILHSALAGRDMLMICSAPVTWTNQS